MDSYLFQHDLPSVKQKWRGWMSCHEQCRADKPVSRKRKVIQTQDNTRCILASAVDQQKHPDVVIDGYTYGNVSRFINHHCGGGNLTKVNVMIDTWDLRCARIGFFARCNIKKGEELLYNYSWVDPEFGSGPVVDSELLEHAASLLLLAASKSCEVSDHNDLDANVT